MIAAVAQEWLEMLDQLNVPYRLHLANDGSTDGTQEVLDSLSHPSLEMSHSRNRGHGPTLIRAYRVAAGRAAWIFQTDSDGELPAASFPEFWQQRQQYDLLIGTRSDREAVFSRRFITSMLKWMLKFFYGYGVQDGNCPYRLMRSDAFRPLLDALPEDTFAPNVLISGYSIRRKLRICEIPVPHQVRQTGVCSIRKGKLFKAALRSGWQTLCFRWRKLPRTNSL